MRKLFIILILIFVFLILYIYSEEIITKIKLLLTKIKPFLDNLKRVILDFSSKIGKEVKREFDKRIKIIEKELEKIILQIKEFFTEQFKKGIQNILDRFKAAVSQQL